MNEVLSKQEARAWAKQQRQALPEAEYRRLNAALIEHLQALIHWQVVRYLHTFLPIERQREPDMRPLLHFLEQTFPNVQIAVPKVKGGRLEHYRLLPHAQLQLSSWGVPEPPDSAPALAPSDFENIDVVLVPLLAFDLRGGRVGYGKGYYDAFLRHLPHALRVGVSLLPPLKAIADLEEHDMPLHLVVTPARTYDFRFLAEKAMHGHLIKKQSNVP
ncbi:5-formyltetrahydrofolate cyclo-ligase [Thermonema rossianum]|uniref:5-formyltetrahydrofolate cyclo-ligase n=1 Tax=Thermonema rossianum TaxID=55505 RepID=UPI00068E9E51|nr:5-formyltetrahydrofolate cyclo-ligase [Thermonema rossianum]